MEEGQRQVGSPSPAQEASSSASDHHRQDKPEKHKKKKKEKVRFSSLYSLFLFVSYGIHGLKLALSSFDFVIKLAFRSLVLFWFV